MNNSVINFGFNYDCVKDSYQNKFKLEQPGRLLLSGLDKEDLRLDIFIESGHADPMDFEVVVDWGTEIKTCFYDHLFIKPPNSKWSLKANFRTGSKTITRFALNPGKTQIAFCIPYKYTDLLSYIERQRHKPLVSSEIGGYSKKKRKIPLLKISNGNASKNCLVVGRCHPYETAASFNIEGMIDFLAGKSELADFFLDRYDFYFLPMINVDGVSDGFDRLTEINGADLNRDIEANKKLNPGSESDSALLTHMRIIDTLKPALYLNLHNWTNKFIDGLIGWDEEEVLLFRKFMPDLTEDYKKWDVNFAAVSGLRSPGRYSRELYGSVGFVLEFPWYGRTEARMREIGRNSLIALVHTGLELESATAIRKLTIPK